MPLHTCPRCKAQQVTGPLCEISRNIHVRRRYIYQDRSRRCRGFLCALCDHLGCLLCGVNHENNETCDEQDYRTLLEAGDCEGASRLRIERECKRCPGCSSNVWKEGGCDAITCKEEISEVFGGKQAHEVLAGAICSIRWCWTCQATYASHRPVRHGRSCRLAQHGRVDVHDKSLSVEELIAAWSESLWRTFGSTC
jgi:hypothetical protein